MVTSRPAAGHQVRPQQHPGPGLPGNGGSWSCPGTQPGSLRQ